LAAVAIVVFPLRRRGAWSLAQEHHCRCSWDNEVTGTLCATLLVAITNLANTKSIAWHRIKSQAIKGQ